MTPPTAAPPVLNDCLRPPPGGPKLRVTIGAGTAAQKTWVLRRPVTLVGSRRKCQVYLPHPEVSKAHCVIVNTGGDILIRDLASLTGTYVNGERVDLAPLCDGDVIRVGPTRIQVAIQTDLRENQDTEMGLVFRDPMAMPVSVTLRQANGGQRCPMTRAVMFIGRHERADVRLDHADVSLAHTLVFHLADRPAVFDLGSRTGTWANGKEQVGVEVGNGTRLRVGPFELEVEASVQPPQEDADPAAAALPGAFVPEQDGVRRDAGNGSTGGHQGAPAGPAPPAAAPPGVTAAGLDDLENRIVTLHQEISHSWDRLARNEKELDARDLLLAEKEQALEQAREHIARQQAALDAQKAELQRGLAELEVRRAETQHQRNVEAEQTALEQRMGEIGAREEALRLRTEETGRAETQLAQQRRQLEEERRQKEGKLEARARQLENAAQTLADREQACRHLEQQQSERDQQFRRRTTALDQRAAELERFAAELNEREASVARLRELVGEMAEAFRNRPEPADASGAAAVRSPSAAEASADGDGQLERRRTQPPRISADDGRVPRPADPGPGPAERNEPTGRVGAVAADSAPKKRSWWRR